MVHRFTRRERRLAGLWIVLTIVLWNSVYDLTLTEGIKEYLFRSALHEAGRGPRVSIASVLDGTIAKAVRNATLWSSVVLVAALATMAALRRRETAR